MDTCTVSPSPPLSTLHMYWKSLDWSSQLYCENDSDAGSDDDDDDLLTDVEGIPEDQSEEVEQQEQVFKYM